MHKFPRILQLFLLVGATLFLMAPVTTDQQAGGKTRGWLFMKVHGQTQGDIQGGATTQGLQGWIDLSEYTHAITSPRDAASGLPTGKRQHKPLTIVKTLDKATPKLMLALVNNETLDSVEIRFYKTSRKGQPENYFTVKLTNASVAAIDYDAQEPGAESESISFTYQKIEWTWTDGGITAEDDWESPVV